MSFHFSHGLFKFDIVDHYAILGVSLRADAKEIRNRYLTIAQILHPDICKAETENEKKLANELLSKLVNPAYEILSKEQTRSEYQLVLSQIGQRLATEQGKITIYSQSAKELFRSANKLDLLYLQKLQALANQEYQSLTTVTKSIAKISELNLVHLVVKAHQKIKQEQEKRTSNTGVGDIHKSSPAAQYLNRAQRYLEQQNFNQALIELKEVLRIDPNSSSGYALWGLTYLRQNKVSMAKVYINKAQELNPRDPFLIEGKRELDKLISYDKKTTNPGQSSSEKSRGSGIFSGLFGNKKK